MCSCALSRLGDGSEACVRGVDSAKGKFNLAPDRCEPELISAAGAAHGGLVKALGWFTWFVVPCKITHSLYRGFIKAESGHRCSMQP